MRHQHADTIDDYVVNLEGTVVVDEPPINFDRRLAFRADDIRRDDVSTFVGSATANLERLATEAGEPSAVDKDHIILEELEIFLLLLLTRATPITAENETGDAGNVEICLE